MRTVLPILDRLSPVAVLNLAGKGVHHKLREKGSASWLVNVDADARKMMERRGAPASKVVKQV